VFKNPEVHFSRDWETRSSSFYISADLKPWKLSIRTRQRILSGVDHIIDCLFHFCQRNRLSLLLQKSGLKIIFFPRYLEIHAQSVPCQRSNPQHVSGVRGQRLLMSLAIPGRKKGIISLLRLRLSGRWPATSPGRLLRDSPDAGRVATETSWWNGRINCIDTASILEKRPILRWIMRDGIFEAMSLVCPRPLFGILLFRSYFALQAKLIRNLKYAVKCNVLFFFLCSKFVSEVSDTWL